MVEQLKCSCVAIKNLFPLSSQLVRIHLIILCGESFALINDRFQVLSVCSSKYRAYGVTQ